MGSLVVELPTGFTQGAGVVVEWNWIEKLLWVGVALALAYKLNCIESKLDKADKQHMILVDLITRLVEALEKKDE